MKFKDASLDLEFHGALMPEVRTAIIDLDDWSHDNGLPEVVVTHVLRTDDDSEAIYAKHAAALLGKLKTGHPLSDSDRKLASTLDAMTPEDVRAWARSRFSWHKVAAAVDLRNKQYTREQLSNVMRFLREGRTIGPWEILSHDVSNGAHIHVGRRDPKWRSTYEAAKAARSKQ